MQAFPQQTIFNFSTYCRSWVSCTLILTPLHSHLRPHGFRPLAPARLARCPLQMQFQVQVAAWASDHQCKSGASHVPHFRLHNLLSTVHNSREQLTHWTGGLSSRTSPGIRHGRTERYRARLWLKLPPLCPGRQPTSATTYSVSRSRNTTRFTLASSRSESLLRNNVTM